MKITDYKFGKLTFGGKEYQSDLVIYDDKIVEEHWWRKEGHLLQLDDIDPFLQLSVKIILVGRGFSSSMRISRELQMYLLENGIVLQGLSTEEAAKRYNEINHQGLLSLFHLTC